MGRNNDKSGRKGPITMSKKGNKHENGSQKRTHKWLKNTRMEACLKHRKVQFFARHLNTPRYAECVRVWGNRLHISGWWGCKLEKF